MHVSLSRIDHRPWPIPQTRWSWRQSWKDLLFAHWPLPASILQPLVPESLRIDEFEGTSWVGVVPFRMTGVTKRPLPDLPWLSAFPELNLRLYVERDGKPGVWFLSLDADNPLAVWAARRFFHLPYFWSEMRIKSKDYRFEYSSRRRGKATVADFRASYRPVSDIFHSKPGTLESFLTERYCLYAQSTDGTMYRGEVHHFPWPLQKAAGKVEPHGLLASHGIQVTGTPLLHFAKQIDVVIWPLERLH